MMLAASLSCEASWGIETPVSANVANLFVGEQKVVEGKVHSAHRDGNTVTLRFGSSPTDFTVSLIIPLLSNFPPDPERAYLGKTVRVVGPIKDFHGVAEMVIRDAGDIQVVGEAPALAASATAAAPSPPEPALQRQVEMLNERLRQMDERLRALEAGAPPAAATGGDGGD